jgi:hypothetical protein
MDLNPGDVYVSNVVANPPPACSKHNFSEWKAGQLFDTGARRVINCIERVCRDCGRIETIIPKGGEN